MEEKMRVAQERKAVELFEKRRFDKGLSVEALAVRLYPDAPAANARMNLNRLRNPQINGKPNGCRSVISSTCVWHWTWFPKESSPKPLLKLSLIHI